LHLPFGHFVTNCTAYYFVIIRRTQPSRLLSSQDVNAGLNETRTVAQPAFSQSARRP